MFSVRKVSYDEAAYAHKIKHLNDCKIVCEIQNLLNIKNEPQSKANVGNWL